MFRMENMAVLLKIVPAEQKHLTSFKFKFVNSVRAFQAFLQLKNHHQLLYLRSQKKRKPGRQPQPEVKVSHAPKKMLHHLEEDDMHQLLHLIQNNSCSSLLFLVIVRFRWAVKLKYLVMSKDLIHKHVGSKV